MESLIARLEQENSEELQIRYDLQTQFSEIIDGSMRTSFDLIFDGVDVYGPDGRGLDGVTKKGLASAIDRAVVDPSLWFEVRRRTIERQEHEELLDMARGKGPNTMVIVSDFPNELINAKSDVGGYNTRRKQAIVRVFTRHDGYISMQSQTLDGSNREALEAIYEHFGIKPAQGELLGQRIRQDLTPKEQAELLDKIVTIYDSAMAKQYGGIWYAGRLPSDIRNTYEFVCQQNDIIEAFIKLHNSKKLTPKLMYDAAATMEERFKNDRLGVVNLSAHSAARDEAVLFHELETIGDRSRWDGRDYSACGLTLRPDGSVSNIGFENAGYAGTSSSECTFNSKKCPECGAKDVRTKVTATRIYGSCGCSKPRKV